MIRWVFVDDGSTLPYFTPEDRTLTGATIRRSLDIDPDDLWLDEHDVAGHGTDVVLLGRLHGTDERLTVSANANYMAHVRRDLVYIAATCGLKGRGHTVTLRVEGLHGRMQLLLDGETTGRPRGTYTELSLGQMVTRLQRCLGTYEEP